MKKITILALHLGYGGVEKSIASLSNILIDRYDVEIISTYKLEDNPAFDIDKRIKVKYLLNKGLSPNRKEFNEAIKSKKILKIIKEGIKSIKILWLKKSKMIKAIKNIDDGIVISTRIEHNSYLSKYGKDSIVTIAQEHAYHNYNNKYIDKLVKSCKNIDYFMPVSKMLRDFYLEHFRNTNTKCLFIPHSLDFIPRESSSLDGKNIISIGRLEYEKGFMGLIDVFSIVNSERPNWKLNIIGGGQEEDIIKDRIKSYGMKDSVVLHGYKDKTYISNEFMKSSIYAMSSIEESFGLVLIEAQSFGIPCVAFDSAKGACEIIEDNVNGYLVENRSKEEMSRKIIKLIDDIDLRKSMGEASKANAYKYSKENVSIQWFEFLDKVDTK